MSNQIFNDITTKTNKSNIKHKTFTKVQMTRLAQVSALSKTKEINPKLSTITHLSSAYVKISVFHGSILILSIII